MNQAEYEYWTNFYEKNKLPIKIPSAFCLFVMDYFKDHKNLNVLDAGCGNGRDSYCLASKYNVIGVDSSTCIPEDIINCKFSTSDFCTFDKTNFNVIYSRFTFHSITNENHKTFLNSIKKNTYLCIETRSDKGANTFRYYGDDHYRNLTNIDYLKNLLNEYNFKILFIEENNNFAIYKNEDPICIRVICIKTE
jgi:SAM-dependent methyltransferase